MSNNEIESSEAVAPARSVWAAVGLGICVAAAFALEHSIGWVEPVFDFVAHQFYEVPSVSALRRPSQLALVRFHLLIFGIASVGVLAVGRFLGRASQRFAWVMLAAYAIRATLWVVGSNLPLVPGDSCHYVEVAASIHRGEGPVKHYVESFFRDYPAIRRGQGVLDDWATPLYAYVLALAYRMTGVDPSGDPETVLAVAKGTSFLINLACLPCLYLFASRRWNREVGLLAVALLAVLPVHALYAAFELRESLVALTSLLAVWFLLEACGSRSRSGWAWTIAAGITAGAAILARNTAMAIMAATVVAVAITHGPRILGRLVVWGLLVLAVIAPWALATQREYGEPFYSYTKYFQYTFSWTVHHYAEGRPSAETFYTWANAPEILRVKIKAIGIMVVTSTMILGLPLVWLGVRGLLRRGWRRESLLWPLLILAFVGGTLANVADVTQVSQLGRYFLPLFCLLLAPLSACAIDWGRSNGVKRPLFRMLALGYVALVWSDPTWAYDYTWLVKPYQLHWPALREAGAWIRDHPSEVPVDARVMTWFPWEVRLTSQRTTVLMPRSYDPRRIDEVIRRYGVTHLVWGSFESPPHVEPESWGRYLESVRSMLGLNDRDAIFRSEPRSPYPVTIYRVRGTIR